MAVPSKTVCLRAFNEDLGGTNPWDSKPQPPPLPKRIAWPGGKIVSNKDEALASFLRRKLDQGHTLTPEQMAMLEKMVDSNLSTSSTAAAAPRAPVAASKKRKIHVADDGWSGDGNGDRDGVVCTTSADARNLLRKLERKVATSCDPCKPGMGVENDFDGQILPTMARRKVDLSSLKRGKAGRGGRRSRGKIWESSTTPAAAAAAADISVPAVYREAWAPNGTANGVGSKGKKRKTQAASMQIQKKGRGRGGKEAVVVASGRGGGGVAGGGGGGGGGGAVAGGKRTAGGGKGRDRSLEDMMSGGLAASRR